MAAKCVYEAAFALMDIVCCNNYIGGLKLGGLEGENLAYNSKLQFPDFSQKIRNKNVQPFIYFWWFG